MVQGYLYEAGGQCQESKPKTAFGNSQKFKSQKRNSREKQSNYSN